MDPHRPDAPRPGAGQIDWSPARYAGVFILALVGLTVLRYLVLRFTEYGISAAALQAVPPMVAAQVEGQRLARRMNPLPGGGAMWRAALGMTGLAGAILVGWTLLGTLLIPGLADAFLAAPLMIAIVLAVYLALFLPLNRFFLGLAARAERRRLDRTGG
ncbi:hypothetical protein HKCCE2091_11540 [Rhodobacterales bacterium HKCCE2091]|nr:hypothetical protein [Rhodobacterales bacterium HKCCE2091]